MATIKFFVRGADKLPSNSKVKSTRPDVNVLIRLRTKDVSAYAVSKITVPRGCFDSKAGELNRKIFPDKAKTEDDLNNLRTFLRTKLRTTPNPSKDWLKRTLDEYYGVMTEGKPVTLFEFIQWWIDKAPTRKNRDGDSISYKQIREYEVTFHYLKAFCKKKGWEYDFEDITLDFQNEFVEFLENVKPRTKPKHGDKNDKGLMKNTISKKVQTLRHFLRSAEIRGYNVNPQYKNKEFSLNSEESTNVYMTMEDLDKLYAVDLKETPSLDRIRDRFIVGCWTGLRYGDWDKIDKVNIDEGFLELKQSKTGDPVVIWLHPKIFEIMEKYGGELPPTISNQKFNEFIKVVCERAGINDPIVKPFTRGGEKRTATLPKCKLVSSHTCRRTYATNLYKEFDVPAYSIMGVTGHKTEAAFIKYLKVNPKEHAKKVKKMILEKTRLKITA